MEHKVDIIVDRAEEDEKLSKKEELKKSMQDSALAMLHSKLETKFASYSSKRASKEAEWAQAERQYAGLLDEEDDKALRSLNSKTVATTPPVVNITRQKTNIAIARMQDIQFPTGGNYNFIIEPTEVPELTKLMQDKTQPADAPEGTTVAEMAEELRNQAWEASQRMERQLQDRFTEADYGKKARHAMDDLCRLGSAILKGPVHQTKFDKAYVPEETSDGGFARALSINTRVIPTVQWVDPRLWYPDPNARPGTVIDDCFEIHLMTRREVAKLAKNPAYMRERIRRVLESDPDVTGLGGVLEQLSLRGSAGSSIDNRYVVKEYHGIIDKSVLAALDLISEDEEEDVLLNIQGEVWFCNNEIIRVSLAPLEGDEEIPYVICTWEEDKGSVFGHGIPYLMRHAQRVVNSSWLMLLDNAGLTAGPQIIINREMITPANKEEGWQIAPMKIWFVTDYGVDAQQAMQFVNIPTQQEAIAQITELAMQFADIESSIPQIQAGEMPSGNNTFGGVAMVLSASHIIQQRVSERWDDRITIPMVQRFFHWEMQYNDDPDIQGDVQVKAGGATERIDKQIKAQDLERILGLASTNPEYQAQIDPARAFRELVATTRAGDILKSPERVKRDADVAAQQAQSAPPDPETVKSQAAMTVAQAQVKEAENRAMEIQGRLQLEQADVMVRREENMVKLQLAQMDRELQFIKMADARSISQDKLMASLNIAAMTDDTKRVMKALDMQKFREEMAIKRETGEGI